MDRNIEWPWSWEEEREWKADLEEGNNDFLDELIDSAVEDGVTGSRYVLGPPKEEEDAEDCAPERYTVTA